jgi:peptidoglycan/xylan/chitin deacetylase (PgdA/CDA1 family)
LVIAIGLAAAAGAVVLAVALFPPRAVTGLLQRRFSVIFTVPTRERVVALTIDDSPTARATSRILEVLRLWNARATFFVIGAHASRRPELVRRIRDEGHEIGNHMMRDRPSVFLTAREFENELLEAERTIGVISESRWFRPGSGWFKSSMLTISKKHGYRCCLASVYAHDTKVRSPRVISRYILARVRPGDIIVLHDRDLPSRTPEVLETILPKLADRGYRVTTVSELLDVASDG